MSLKWTIILGQGFPTEVCKRTVAFLFPWPHVLNAHPDPLLIPCSKLLTSGLTLDLFLKCPDFQIWYLTLSFLQLPWFPTHQDLCSPFVTGCLVYFRWTPLLIKPSLKALVSWGFDPCPVVPRSSMEAITLPMMTWASSLAGRVWRHCPCPKAMVVALTPLSQ